MHDHPFQLNNEITHAIFISSGTIPLVIDKLIKRTRAIGKTRNNGTPEQHHSETRNTGTLKILNLLKIRKKITGEGGRNYCWKNYCVKHAF